MNNIFLLIPSFTIIGVLFILLFLDIGCKAYDYFMTIKAKKMLKKGWRCCSLCSNEKCLFRGDKTGDGCYGEYEALKYMYFDENDEVIENNEEGK